jgi:hypothetical protein
MIKPIPKKLLPHEVFYLEYDKDNGEGETFKQSITLKNVRIEDNKQFNYTSNGRELMSNATLFYDYINSSGLTNEPVINSIIEFKDKKYRIVNIEPLYANSNIPHHYEVSLK